ncbi:MAG: hypothetical protein IT336_09195 [Thermomicrobiales bacterium]|nr:hypothetical protein [Thermomicrobiales bacterium]
MSNDFLVRHFGDMDLSLEDLIEIAASPVPAPDDGLLYVSDVREVTLLADGRIAALVLLEQGQSDRPELTSVITFVERDGTLLLDAWQPVTLESSTGGGWQVVEGDGYNGVIVPGDLVADFLYGFFNEPIQGSWTPSAEQIATLEANLPAYLERAPAAAPDLHERVADYHRQYLGYVIEGRALILVNAFCSVPGIDWTSDMVFVMDGGDCYFVVSYDVTTGEFLDLRINGEA